jgi:hypothetical protein
VATVISGVGRLRALWSRDVSRAVEGVVGLDAALEGGARVVVSGGDELSSFDAVGEVGRAFEGPQRHGTPFGFRQRGRRHARDRGFPAGGDPQSVVVALRSRQRALDCAFRRRCSRIARSDIGASERRLVVATMRGAAQVSAGASAREAPRRR